jgi:hypothetical protein
MHAWAREGTVGKVGQSKAYSHAWNLGASVAGARRVGAESHQPAAFLTMRER